MSETNRTFYYSSGQPVVLEPRLTVAPPQNAGGIINVCRVHWLSHPTDMHSGDLTCSTRPGKSSLFASALLSASRISLPYGLALQKVDLGYTPAPVGRSFPHKHSSYTSPIVLFAHKALHIPYVHPCRIIAFTKPSFICL